MPPPVLVTSPLPRREDAVVSAWRSPRSVPGTSLPFFLFLLVNATLFVRPAEVVPGLIGWPIYQVLILTCLALAPGPVLAQLTPAALAARPITVCLLGLLPLVMLSQLAQLNVSAALSAGFEFGKVLVYYLLLVGLIDSPGRLRRFLFWLAVFLAASVGLALLNYYGILTLPNLTVLKDGSQEAVTGRKIVIMRLQGSGLFNDPNEMCLPLVFGMALGLYWAGERRLSLLRFFWLVPVAMCVYAISLTQSRGGFLALLAALLVLFLVRFGRARTLLLGTMAVPVLFMLFAGRQTSVSVAEQTAHDRIDLWSDGLVMLRYSPLFGVGHGNFSKIAGMVAHNSFLHCFAELGFLAGTLFLGAFYFGLRELAYLGSPGKRILDADMGRLRPYLLAAGAGYVVGMSSVSVSFTMTTYTVLGLATVYLRVTPVYPPPARSPWSGRLVLCFLLVSVVFLIGMHVFVRLSR